MRMYVLLLKRAFALEKIYKDRYELNKVSGKPMWQKEKAFKKAKIIVDAVARFWIFFFNIDLCIPFTG